MDNTTIKVWRFADAPEEYRNLSFRGDEDWLAFVPASLAEDYIPWMVSGSAFGCCDVVEHRVPGGVVRIGSH